MAETALAAPTERLSPCRRIDLADHLIDLVAAALLLHHPHAARLGELRVDRFYTRRTDAVLLAGISRLTAFIAEQAAQGNLLPPAHPLYVSPPEAL